MSSTRSATPRRTTARRTTAVRRPPARRRAGRRRPSVPVRRAPRQAAASWGWLTVVLAVVALLAVSLNTDRGDTPVATAQCTLPATGVRLTDEQIGNARTIAQVGYERGLPERAVVIALATAMQESRLRNLDHGDRDSLGLFQQRPSQGWGAPDQVQDPVHASGEFYDVLVQVSGWETRPLGEAAHAVQRSAYPELVPRFEPMAVELAAAFRSSGWSCG